MRLTIAEADGATNAAVGIVDKMTDKVFSSDSILLIALFCLPVVYALVYGLLWRFGGGKERDTNKVKISEAQRDAMVCVREIVQIHSDVLTKSNGEYAALLAKHREQSDRSPSPRLRKEAAEA